MAGGEVYPRAPISPARLRLRGQRVILTNRVVPFWAQTPQSGLQIWRRFTLNAPRRTPYLPRRGTRTKGSTFPLMKDHYETFLQFRHLAPITCAGCVRGLTIS